MPSHFKNKMWSPVKLKTICLPSSDVALAPGTSTLRSIFLRKIEKRGCLFV